MGRGVGYRNAPRVIGLEHYHDLPLSGLTSFANQEGQEAHTPKHAKAESLATTLEWTVRLAPPSHGRVWAGVNTPAPRRLLLADPPNAGEYLMRACGTCAQGTVERNASNPSGATAIAPRPCHPS